MPYLPSHGCLYRSRLDNLPYTILSPCRKVAGQIVRGLEPLTGQLLGQRIVFAAQPFEFSYFLSQYSYRVGGDWAGQDLRRRFIRVHGPEEAQVVNGSIHEQTYPVSKAANAIRSEG